MAQYESIDRTLERRKRMQAKYPQLASTSPSTLLEVDSYTSGRGSLPSPLSQDMVKTANQTTALQRFREVDRATPIPDSRQTPYLGRSGRPQPGEQPREGLGLEDVLGGVAGYAGDVLKRMPSDIGSSALTALEQLDRPRGAFFGSIAGSEAASNPLTGVVGSVRGAVEGFRDPRAFQGRDSSLARGASDVDQYPFGLSQRDVLGGVLDIAFDPVDLATGGTVGTDIVKAGRRGAKALSDDITETAIRRAEGPLDASTMGNLRPAQALGNPVERKAFSDYMQTVVNPERWAQVASAPSSGRTPVGTLRDLITDPKMLSDLDATSPARFGPNAGKSVLDTPVYVDPGLTGGRTLGITRTGRDGNGVQVVSHIDIAPDAQPWTLLHEAAHASRATRQRPMTDVAEESARRLGRGLEPPNWILDRFRRETGITPPRITESDLASPARRQALGMQEPTRVYDPSPGAVQRATDVPPGRARVSGSAAAPPSTGFDAPPTVQRLYGVDTIEEGAQRGRVERFIESGRVKPDEPVATPGLLVRSEARNAVRNQATQVGERARSVIADSGFEFDDVGRIPSLGGIDPEIPGAPTLRDVAARLPKFEPYLSDDQLDALDALREAVAPYRQALDEVAQQAQTITGKPASINVGSRADVMEGGFYIPRGTAETEELADIAAKRITGGGGRAGKSGFEKTTTFPSEAAGIEAGYAYTPVADSIGGYVRRIGDTTLDQHAANYFLSRVDDAGNRIAESVADRAMRLDPKLKTEVTGLKSDLQNLRGAEGRLTARQTKVLDEFLSDPDLGDIDALRDAVDSIRIGAYRGQPGRNFGMALPDVQGMKQAVLDRIEELRPEYQRLQKQALGTPRDQGRIPLRGLEAYSFPWEVADEARRVLEGETRNPGAALQALNSLMRGIQATGEMSYLGIQGAIGMASGNRAWRRATKAATQAWMNSGENVLGRHIVQFDKRAAKAGLPSVEDWASRGLRLGGGNTEFAITGRVGIPDLPGVAGKVQDVAGSVPKRADRGFGTFGDVIRLELADTLAEESKLAGRALSDAELESIVKSVNRSSGWSPTRLGGNVGEALNFAPRYLAARIQALGQLGSKNVRDRQLARRLIGRYVAIASLMTIAANEALGEETDFRPFSGSKGPTWNPMDAEYKNPNFMRVRALGRDWSFLGPVDATLGVAVGAGSLLSNPTADPKESLNRMRSVFTAPLVSAGLDWLVFGENFDREKLDNAEALGKDLLTRVVPFAAPELVDTTIESVGQAQAGDVGSAASGAAGGLLQSGVGFRGSPMSTSERVKAGGFRSLQGRDQFEGIASEAWRELGNDPEFKAATEKYGSVYQYQQTIREEVIREARKAGMSMGQADFEAAAAVRSNPLYQSYLDIRNGLRTWWVEQNPAEAVKLRDEQALIPERDRDWTPTVEQREIMDAYLAGRE